MIEDFKDALMSEIGQLIVQKKNNLGNYSAARSIFLAE